MRRASSEPCVLCLRFSSFFPLMPLVLRRLTLERERYIFVKGHSFISGGAIAMTIRTVRFLRATGLLGLLGLLGLVYDKPALYGLFGLFGLFAVRPSRPSVGPQDSQ
jgi:hypothetical protein